MAPQPNSSTSFWHSEPSEFLLGHRTTPELPEEADIVIIGSGITGASISRFLSEDIRAKNLNVIMLEAREACWCATGRNGGHCQPLLFKSAHDVAAFEIRNVEAVRSYIEEHDVACEWRSLEGCRTFWTPSLAEEVEKFVPALKAGAPELGKRIELIHEEAALSRHRVRKAICATLTLAAASLWPYKLVAFILEKSIKAGRLNLQTKTPVNSISQIQGHHDQGQARSIVHTDRGSIKTRHVILATNAYTSHLLPEFADLIVPIRGVMSALLPPKGMTRLENSYGFVGVAGGAPDLDDYLIQRPHLANNRNRDYLTQRPFENVPNPVGHLMFGGGRAAATLEAVGETDDSVVDPGCARYLRERLLKIMSLGGETEGLKELKATRQWSGIWGTSKDNHPWVGPVPGRSGVWLSGGYSGE